MSLGIKNIEISQMTYERLKTLNKCCTRKKRKIRFLMSDLFLARNPILFFE